MSLPAQPASSAILIRAGKVLLIRRLNPPAADLYAFPGGRAEPGETPVFSWTAWPDRATCDAAGQKMQAAMEGQDMPEMPFDGMRMVWGGFEPIFDTGAKP